MIKTFVIFVLATLSFCSQSAIIKSSELYLVSQAQFDISRPYREWDLRVEDEASQFRSADTLSVDSRIRGAEGFRRVRMLSTAEATWNDADSGSVMFNDIGWQTDNFSNSGLFNGGAWIYEFSVLFDSVFTLSWDINADPNNTSVWPLGFQPALYENDEFLGSERFYLDALPEDNSYSLALTGGNTYTVWLSVGSNLFGGIGSTITFADMQFDWNIQNVGSAQDTTHKTMAPQTTSATMTTQSHSGLAVPEPSTIALLGASLLLLRRRYKR